MKKTKGIVKIRNKYFVARIYRNNEIIYLGCYKTLREAIKRRKEELRRFYEN